MRVNLRRWCLYIAIASTLGRMQISFCISIIIIIIIIVVVDGVGGVVVIIVIITIYCILMERFLRNKRKTKNNYSLFFSRLSFLKNDPTTTE